MGKDRRSKSGSRSTYRSRKGSYGRSVSSSSRSGIVTKYGTKVRNPKAYAKTGANMYSASSRRKVNNPTKFVAAVKRNSMHAAAKSVVKQNPRAKAFTYTAKLAGGKKYVGYTANPRARIKAHTSGSGAQVTRELPPSSIKITPHRSIAAAKKAETKTYLSLKATYGSNQVRGAGNSTRFSLR